MRKLLLMMLFITLLSSESRLQAQCFYNRAVGTEIPVKGVENDTKDDLVMRSVTQQYVRAFICDKNINVFSGEIKIIQIVVINRDTGQIMYSEDYTSSDNINFQLDSERGSFEIRIICENKEFRGDFIL